VAGGFSSATEPPHLGTFPLGKTGYSIWANAFLDRFEALSGMEPQIYFNTNYATSSMDSALAGRDVWIANWSQPANNQTGDPATGVLAAWSLWQCDSPNGLGATYGSQRTDIDLDGRARRYEFSSVVIDHRSGAGVTGCMDRDRWGRLPHVSSSPLYTIRLLIIGAPVARPPPATR
jgi:hypothetical protein